MADTKPTAGYTGLAEWGGQIYEEFITDLRFGPGGKGYAKYNEMRLNAPVLAALLASIEKSVLAMGWQVTGDGEDDPRIEFVQENIDGLVRPLKNHLCEALTCLPFGWSYFETIYQRQGGRLTWAYFAPRGQNTLIRWQIEGDAIKGMVQYNQNYQEVAIPTEKSILYRISYEKNNPEGRSIFRPAWTSYYFWKNISTIEAIGVERDLAGLPKVTMPEGASPDDTDTNSDAYKANKMVRNIRNDEQAGVVLPFGWQFDLISTGGSRQFDTDKIISRYENRMLMSALAQFLMLGTGETGSYSLSKDQTDFFTMSVNSVADALADTFTSYAIRPLLSLNGFDPDGVTMTHTAAGDADLSAIGAFLQQVASLITWTVQDEKWLRQQAHMPEIDEAELMAERDAKQARSDAIQQAIQAKAQQGSEPKPDEENDEQQYSAEWFYSRKHTDQERRVWEGRMQKVMAGVLAKQQARVMAGARGLKNG